MTPEFRAFGKTARLYGPVTITEKIDGTNGLVYVGDEGVWAGSRNRWLTDDGSKGGWDNHGFGKWVSENRQRLADLLGPGYHYGEWWGKGIQRGYGTDTKRFSLFDVERYKSLGYIDDSLGVKLVPRLYAGEFSLDNLARCSARLMWDGSRLCVGVTPPEGLVVRWEQPRVSFKVVFPGPEKPAKCKRSKHDLPPRRQYSEEEIAELRRQAAERKLVSA